MSGDNKDTLAELKSINEKLDMLVYALVPKKKPDELKFKKDLVQNINMLKRIWSPLYLGASGKKDAQEKISYYNLMSMEYYLSDSAKHIFKEEDMPVLSRIHGAIEKFCPSDDDMPEEILELYNQWHEYLLSAYQRNFGDRNK